MTDLRVTESGEFMVAQIEGASERGVEWVDAYVAPAMIVPDAGRIIVHVEALEGVLFDARRAGLSYDLKAAAV